MASELVPGDFLPLKLMQVFADFREDHKRSLESPTNYSFMKKKTLIRAKNSSADFTNLFVVEGSVIYLENKR